LVVSRFSKVKAPKQDPAALEHQRLYLLDSTTGELAGGRTGTFRDEDR
jgi:hypothetical protein